MSQTELLALWGAVTGTIGTFAGLLGLWLRFRQYGQDKPKLKCESNFGFQSPESPKHTVTARAIGRRPFTIDKIKYYISPKKLKDKLFKYWLRKPGKWVCYQAPKQTIKLSEGEKVDISISLPDGICITEIYKVEIVDQTGKSWPVGWLSQSSLEKIATQEKLNEYSEENGRRSVNVIGYRLGESYFVEVKFNNKLRLSGGINGKGFWFSNLRMYQEKLDEIIKIQAEGYLFGEREEIQ